MKMNKNSIEPIYQQLAEIIKQQILNGELKESEKLMTESELCDYYNVSRITVRQAVNLLVEKGFVTKKQGIGTFVTAKKLSRVMSFNKIMSFTEMCKLDGKKPSSELISTDRVKAGAELSGILGVNKDEQVLKIVRVRKIDGISVMIEESYLPEKFFFVAEENLNESLCGILEKHGAVPMHAKKIIEIYYASEREKRYLGVKMREPLLFHRDVIADEKGEVLMVSKLIIDPKRYTLTILI